MHACMCACVRACVHVCVCVGVCGCVRVCARVSTVHTPNQLAKLSLAIKLSLASKHEEQWMITIYLQLQQLQLQ